MLLKEDTPCCQDLCDLRKDEWPWRAERDQKIQSETSVWKDYLSPKSTMGILNNTKHDQICDPFGTHWRIWSIECTKTWVAVAFDSMQKICVCVQWHVTLHTGPLDTFWVNAWQSCCSRCDLLGHGKCGRCGGRCGISVPCEWTSWRVVRRCIKNTKSKHPGIAWNTQS